MRRFLVSAIVGLGAAALWAQAPPAASAEFTVYLIGREIGRETATVAVDGAVRRINSTLTFAERGTEHRLTAMLETGLDGTPRRLVVQGDRPREGRVDLDQRTPPAEAGRPAFLVEAGAPYSLQEYLIRYWRTYGRPREFAASPVGPIRIQTRAEAQLDLGNGRPISIERVSVEGPVFGRETAWVEPGGNLLALVTWAGGLPVQVIRAGYESRLSRFIDEALRDRLVDADRLTNQAPPEHADGVVLTGGTVIVGGKKAPIPNATVVVRNGRIAEVGPADKIKPPADLPSMDASGATIVAGLWDLHGQISQAELLPVLLAAGTTTILSFSPDTAFFAALRSSWTEDHLVGPRLLPPGGYIDGAGPSGAGVAIAATPAEGRAQVRKLRGDGIRIIQIGDATPAPVAAAIAQEANRSAVRVVSPLTMEFTATQSLDAGVDVLQFGLSQVRAGDASVFADMAKRQRTWEPMAAWEDLQAENGFTARHPLLANAPAGLTRRFAGRGAADYQHGALISLLRAARAAGVHFLAGTGSGIPGSQIVRELELYVEAGMPTAEALHLVTAGAAQMMKIDDAGTVEGGKRADLLILTGNPLDNIGNLRNIRFVVANGKVYDPAKLLKAVGWN